MEKVSDYYDAVAADYHHQYQRENLHSSKEYPANYFRLQILIQRLAAAQLSSVYEVGVGEGTPLTAIAAMGLRVAGCDISESMVTRAREAFSRHGLDPNLVQWGDAEDATTLAAIAKPGTFDAAIAAGVLPHVRNDALFLNNVGMLVRSGGLVFIEFRNKLFSLFTLNRYTKEFILDELLIGVSPNVKAVVEEELNKRFATDMPPVRAVAEGGTGPGYDMILSRFHNPFELLEIFKQCGYRDMKVHWYHYHPAPPMLEGRLGDAFRRSAMQLEHEGTWRGWFLCSAGVIEAVKG